MPRNGSIDHLVEQSTGNGTMMQPLKKAFGLLSFAGIAETVYFLSAPMVANFFDETSIGAYIAQTVMVLAAGAAGGYLSIATKNGLDERIDGVYRAVLKQFKPKNQLVLNYTV